MIDPVTAFATAQAAIKGVQAAIKMGKDIQAVSKDIMKFFDAKDVVVKAATKSKSSKGRSDTSRALETAMNAKALVDAENELKELLIYSGNGDVWNALLVERNAIAARRKAEALEARRASARAKARLVKAAEIFLIIIFILLASALALAGIVLYLK
jgi:hypothetical protein